MGWADKFASEGAPAADATAPAQPEGRQPVAAPAAPSGGWAAKYQRPLPEHVTSPQQPAQYGMGLRSNPNPVGPIDAARIATIEDPRVKVKQYAAARFPNEPPEVREARYMTDDSGRVFYRDDAGGLLPEVSGGAAAMGAYAGEFMLPITGAVLGALMAPATGGASAVPAASALLGMGGLAANKLIGLAQGDVQDSAANARDLALQGAIDFAVPAAAGKTASVIANRRAAKDVMRLDRAGMERLIRLAKARGITLTPAEASNLGSLINRQINYGTGMDEAGDVMKKFFGDRAEQVAGAVDDFLRQSRDLDVAGMSARDVARQSIDDAYAAVSTGSRNAYQVANRGNLVDERAFMNLDSDPLITKYIDRVKDSPEFGLMDDPRNSTAVIDMAGKLMREDAEKASASTFAKGQVTERALRRGRNRLLSFMERQYPSYKQARTTQAMMRETHLNPLEEGIEGVIARTKDTSLSGIPKKLLSSESVTPRSVANWRREFVSQGREQDWDRLVGAYLKQIWEGSAAKGRSVKEVRGARFAEMVMGTPAQRKIMREAMGPERFQNFSDLIEVLEATGRAYGRQSQTAAALAEKATSRREAAPIASRVGDFDLTSPQKWLTDWWVENAEGNWRASLARAITSPDAVAELDNLRLLRRLSPGSLKKTQAVAQILAKAGVIAAAENPNPEPFPQQFLQPRPMRP